MDPSEFIVDVGVSSLEDGKPALTVKIQTKALELNVWIPETEVHLLKEVAAAGWNDRRSVQIGRCANSPVFWSSKEGETSVLVGHDDETWDVGLTLPRGAFEQILDSVQAEQAAHATALRNAARERQR
jgi:hypothetical protein